MVESKKPKKRPERRKTAARKPVTIRAGVISKINRKLDRLERKMDAIRKEQRETEDVLEETTDSTQDVVEREVRKISREVDAVEGEVQDVEKNIEKVEQDIDRIEKDIDQIGENVSKMEENLLTIGRFTVGREHFMEMARGAAGAFLGVGIGMGIRWIPGVAESLEWINVISILIFILAVGALLVYKYEKEWVEKHGGIFVVKRILFLFVISMGIEAAALLLFNMMPVGIEAMVKTLIVGSYPAMAGAITFTIA